MTNQLRQAVEDRKQFYIQKLLNAGIFKRANRQLYELTLSELEKEYRRLHDREKSS